MKQGIRKPGKTRTNSWERGYKIGILEDKLKGEERAKIPPTLDTQNRAAIVQYGIQYQTEGLPLDEAVEKILKEHKELVAKFEYLTRNNVNIKECFKNWIKVRVKSGNKER